MFPHQPVLIQPYLRLLEDRPLKIVVDGTLGAGGHAHALLEAHPEIEQFIGIDQDDSALALAKERLQPWQHKTTFVHARFDQLKQIMQEKKASSILLDIGVSSMQLDQAHRGFSFQNEGPLDMRMDSSSSLTAADIVNHYGEKELSIILRDYGEEPLHRRIAFKIVREREEKPFTSTKELADFIARIIPKKKSIHPATLTFQALRIAVNDELAVLERTLPQALDCLEAAGVLAVMTFHSLEDRIVKHYFQQQASSKVSTSGPSLLQLEKEPAVHILTRKPIEASEEEIARNPRARSAKLRAVEKR